MMTCTMDKMYMHMEMYMDMHALTACFIIIIGFVLEIIQNVKTFGYEKVYRDVLNNQLTNKTLKKENNYCFFIFVNNYKTNAKQ